MKKICFTLLCFLVASVGWSQDSRKDIEQDIHRSGSNFFAYPMPEKALTPSPKDKAPFYISHYGRHGSRYHCESSDYDIALGILCRADSAGKLTAKGKDVLEKVKMMRRESDKRIGELTELGAEQHRGIARRMYEHFPEVFGNGCVVDAKSTIVIRCILSMENELQELAKLNPTLKFKHDASEHDMYYMNFDDKQLVSKRYNDATKKYLDAWTKKNINPSRVMSVIFNDASYVNKNIDSQDFYNRLFLLASILQDSELRHEIDLYDIFTKDEIYALWQRYNAGWFCEFGSCKLNGAIQPFTQRNLLSKIVSEADSCVALDKPGATLRFGHETVVLPLTCLLDLNGYGKTMHPDELENNHWYNYKIFPMGCNIQFIFYRHDINDKDIWVKVLLNEEEATLPIKAVEGPYYRWSDVRKYCLNKLDSYKQ